MTSRSARPERRGARTSWNKSLARAVSAIALLGCSAMLEREQDQCRTSRDCEHFGVGAVCTTNGTCRGVMTGRGPNATNVTRSCEVDADCGTSALCRNSACSSLERAGCAIVSAVPFDASAERLPLLVLLPSSVLVAKQISGAVRTAVNGWSAARQDTPGLPELLVVQCNASDLGALDLTDTAGISLVISATRAVELGPVVDAVGGRAVIFAPFAEAPGLPSLVESREATSVVSCKPNRADSISSMLSALSGLRSALERNGLAPDRETVVALSREEGLYGYDVLLDGAVVGGRPVELITYDASLSGDGLVSALKRAALQPGLIVGISGEVDWSPNLRAVEDSKFGALQPPPYYVLTERQEGVRDLAIRDQPVQDSPVAEANPLRHRLALWDYQLGERNREVHEQFAVMFGVAPEVLSPYLDNLHDCFYVATYAALSAQLYHAFSVKQIKARSVLVGLRALKGGLALQIGPSDLSEGLVALAAARGRESTLDLLGGSGDLDFVDLLSSELHYAAPKAPPGAFYCANAVTRNYCSTGVTASQSGELSGVNECPCFNLH